MSSAKQTNPHFRRVDRAPYELGHLLKKMPADFTPYHPLTPDDRLIAEAARNHAMNANDALMRGLAALGHVMSVAGANSGGDIDSCQFMGLGELLTHIAVESQFLQETEWSLREILVAHDERAAAAAKSTGGKKGVRAEVEA